MGHPGSNGIVPRHRLVERWVARRLGNGRHDAIEHERRVARVAGTLFDLTRPLHDLTSADRRLLHVAALVHDVGRCRGGDGHAVEGARMVLAADASLPLSAAERRGVAYLTRYHRGGVPDLGHDEMLCASDDPRRLRLILAMLRAADALDSRALASPRLVFALRGRRLNVGVYLDDDSPKARKVYGRPKKLNLLEELLGLRVEVEVHLAEAFTLVA
jgi:exopolyphosphatase/pppGpp-phosphohydrolase